MKQKRRFPRIASVTSRTKLCEKLLHTTYNSLAKSRSIGLRTFGRYDLYTSKNGIRAQFMFTILAQELLQRKIDPAAYLKTMMNYGQYANAKYMPHPVWLAEEATIKNYEWLHKRERNKWEREEDYKRSQRGFREKDIFRAIETSGDLLQHALKNFPTMRELDAVVLLIEEISPWMLAAYIPNVPQKVCEVILAVLKEKQEIHRATIQCLLYFRRNDPTWQRARKVLRRVFAE